MERKHPASGFTLIEACVVLLILGITAIFAVDGLSSFRQRKELDGVVSTLVSDFQSLRSQAVSANSTIFVAFGAGQGSGSCYVAYSGVENDCSCDGEGGVVCDGGSRRLASFHLASVSRTQFSSITNVRYAGTHGTISPTMTVAVTGPSGHTVNVIVNIMGRVRTCSVEGLSGYSKCSS